MVFSSLLFIFVFFAIFLISYFCFKNLKYRNFIILIFSLAFYAYGEPIYLTLIILSIIVNYLLALRMDKSQKKKLYLILSLVFNLGLLGIFKYTDFFIDILNFTFKVNLPGANIVLPIGISFYTFQILSYVIDVYRNKVKVQKNIFYLGGYITFFPQLIAGPIVRYETIEEELNERKVTASDFAYGIRRFIMGLSKKVLLADTIGYMCANIFALDASIYGFIGALIGLVCYSLQLYFDFSGYSDMAIGMGRMFGFHFLENFNYPYIAKSITDFWRRWHISLSTFFRDYVYIPLGGNRVKKGRYIINVMIVWSLTGLWHGASINFVLWGVYYGVLLLAERLFWGKYLEKWPNFWRHLYTLIIVLIGWGLFYSTNWSILKDLFTSLIGLNGFGNINMFNVLGLKNIKYVGALILGILFVMPVHEKIMLGLEKMKFGSYIKDLIYLLLFIISIIGIIVSSYSPFIYFRF